VRATRRSPRGWLIATAATLIAGVLVLVTALSSRSAERRPFCRSSLIPAYVGPAAITDLVESSEHPRLLLIINPASGPGTDEHPLYREAVGAAHAGGARVLGYVPTGYGGRDLAAAEADIDRYRSWYGVDGIFLDEVSHDAAQLPYYRPLSRYARAAGGGVVALNPGTVPARGYFDLADVVVTFEGPVAAYAEALARTPNWVRRLPSDRIAHLVYAASREEALAAAQAPRGAGWLYVTSGGHPDPWRTVPDYLQEEEEALRRCS
jgi:hypothetical protein